MRDGFGIALGSGGGRGWCHIGALRALGEAGYVPGGVAGCSMGALVGAAWAADKLDALEVWARKLTRAQLLTYIDLALGQGGLVAGRAVMRLLDDLDIPERIEDLPRPLAVVATDMASGREVWFIEGDLRDAIRASVSIPGVFRPHQVGGRWLLDGGLTNPLPISAVRALGFRHTLAVNPNARGVAPLWTPPEPGQGLWAQLAAPTLVSRLPAALQGVFSPQTTEAPAPDYLQVVAAAIDMLTGYLTATRTAADPPDVLLEASLGHIGVLELDRAAEAIEEGHAMVAPKLDQLRRMLG